MGNSPHRVRPQLHRVDHQLLAVGVAQDALLGKGHDLKVHYVPQLLPQLHHGLHGHQGGIGHIHMGADVLDSVGGVHPHRPVHPVLDVLLRELLLPFGPAVDTLKEGPRHVPHRIPGGETGVQMDMGLDKGRQHQLVLEIHHLLPRLGGQLRTDGGKSAILHPDTGGGSGVFDQRILKQHFRVPLKLFSCPGR